MLLLHLSFCVGPQEDCVIGAAIGDLDEAGDEVASILQFYQSVGTVDGLPNQGSPPQDIPVLVNVADYHPIPDSPDQVGSILESNQRWAASPKDFSHSSSPVGAQWASHVSACRREPLLIEKPARRNPPSSVWAIWEAYCHPASS
jgi:hypothetical protein